MSQRQKVGQKTQNIKNYVTTSKRIESTSWYKKYVIMSTLWRYDVKTYWK